MTTYFNHKIERINCPFDFTRTGSVGLNYAGMLAAALGARLTIFYVEPSFSTEEPQLYEDLNDNNKGIRRLLKLEAETMKERYGIESDYAIDHSTDSIEVAVGSRSTDYDLIVMGTNGADNLYQQVFGVNTHHLLGLTRCPVLMIPQGYELRLPKQMVIVFDQETNSDFLLSQLERLSLPLNAYVRALPVENDGTAKVEHKIELLGEMLGIREQRAIIPAPRVIERRIAAIQNDAVHRSERSCRMRVTAEHNVSPGHAQAGESMPIADSVALAVGPGALAHTAQE